MTTDSFFALMLGSILALFFGFLLTVAGYRFFTILLPILGFLFGFAFGGQMIQAILGQGFLSTVVGWIAGFFFAVLFAVCSYLFYFLAVAVVAGALGYALGSGLTEAIGFDFQFMVWIVGVVLGLAVAGAALYLNVQKWVVILATSVLGAGTIVGTYLFLFGGLPSAEVAANPVRAALQASPFWMINFIILAALGVVVQFGTTRGWEAKLYERWTWLTSPTGGAAAPAAPAGEQIGGLSAAG